MRYTFKRGEWSSGSNLLDWADGEDFDEYLRRIKFQITPMKFGADESSQIQIYESEENPIFMADVKLKGNVYNVYLPDFPSMMMFVRDHAAAFSAESANNSQNEILEIIKKLFQVTHGHDSNHICKECDPIEWKIQQDRLSKK